MREFYTALATALHPSHAEAQRHECASGAGGNRMNEDQIKGKAEKAKGYVKEKTGELTGNGGRGARGGSRRQAGSGSHARIAAAWPARASPPRRPSSSFSS
jgi:uncharacterized protein YjbJ (UPF0337 family)